MQNSIQKFFGHTQQKIPNSSKDFFQASLETIFALPKSNYRIPGGISISGFPGEFFCTPPTKNSRGGELFFNSLPIGGLSKILLSLGWGNGATDERMKGRAFLALPQIQKVNFWERKGLRVGAF